MINPNDTVYPRITQPAFTDGHGYHTPEQWSDGITKREHFAAMAMQWILADPNTIGDHQQVALGAVNMADALIEALNKPTPWEH